MPHRFHVPEQRAERLCGPNVAGSGIIILSTCLVGLVSMETTGLTPVDLSTSLAQLNDNFSLSLVSSFLTSPLPSLVVRFAPWSSNNPMVGLGDVGWR